MPYFSGTTSDPRRFYPTIANVPHRIALHCTALHRTAPLCTAPYRTAPHCTRLNQTAPQTLKPLDQSKQNESLSSCRWFFVITLIITAKATTQAPSPNHPTFTYHRMNEPTEVCVSALFLWRGQGVDTSKLSPTFISSHYCTGFTKTPLYVL